MIAPSSVCRLCAQLALAAATVAAQTNDAAWNTVKALEAGTQLRVTTGSHTLSGRIDSITDDRVVVNAAKGPESFERQQISVIWVKKATRHQRNTLIGLAIGAGAGLGVGIAARAKPDQLHIVPNSAIVAIFTAAGAVAGILVGVLIPTGGWREIYRK